MSYNITQLQAVDTIGGLLTYVNEHSQDMLGGGLLIALFFILLMRLKRYAFEQALAVASFWTFFFSVLGAWAGFVNWFFCLLFLVVLAGAGWMVYQKKS